MSHVHCLRELEESISVIVFVKHLQLKSLRATALHSLKGGKTLPSEKNFIRLHMFPKLLAEESYLI